MLKLSISASLIAHTVSSTINYGMNFYNQILADEEISKITEEQMKKRSEKEKISIEKLKQQQDEINKGYVEALTEFATNYKDKMNFENKFLKTEMNDEEFTLEIKEEFLIDMVDSLYNCYEQFTPVLVKFVPAFRYIDEANKAFNEKWYESKPKVTTTESKELEIVFSSNDWDFVIKQHNKPQALLLKDGESTVMVDDFVVLNKETKTFFNIYTHTFKYVLNNDTDLLDDKYPKSLQAALKDLLTDYYKVVL